MSIMKFTSGQLDKILEACFEPDDAKYEQMIEDMASSMATDEYVAASNYWPWPTE
jgi:hypothetical protein